MEKAIKFYKLTNNGEVAFPNSDLQLMTSDFTYSASRMGSAPTITCTVMYPRCLDGEWGGDVYCYFNGEKFYVQRTPSSSHDNTDARYKHEISLVSNRIVLDNVLFFDVVNDSGNDNKQVAKSTNFSFFGTLSDLAQKLNASLAYSGLQQRNSKGEYLSGYRVVVDEGYDTEGKLLSFSDSYITSALQQINTEFEKKYYFDGYTIHIGEYQNKVGYVFEYGAEKSLLSIKKQNANNKIINRITGVGSSDNIPYYYPNETEKGQISLVVENNKIPSSAYTIVNKKKLAASVDLDSPVTLEHVSEYATLEIENTYRVKNGGYVPFVGGMYILPFDTEPHITKDGITTTKAYYEISATVTVVSGGTAKLSISGGKPKDHILYPPIEFKTIQDPYSYCVRLQGSSSVGSKITPVVSFNDRKDNANISLLVGDVVTGDKFDVQFGFYIEAVRTEEQEDSMPNDTLLAFTVGYYQYEEHTYKWRGSRKSSEKIEDFGLSLSLPQNAKIEDYVGASFKVVRDSYYQTYTNLMPWVARKSGWTERFYNAIDDTYSIDGELAVFDNPYVEGKPLEHIENFDDIKPTIKGAKYNRLRIDMFAAIEYDKDDNDEMDENGKYYHPYFFVRLKPLGFNLFDHAIESQPMTISMTSGHCGACEFEIGVDETTQKNRVQVINGVLQRDELGNVKCGRPVYKNGEWITYPDPSENAGQDTTNESVWIALKKDENTFGQIMPNNNSRLHPSTSDTFVILNIDLPDAYIKNAEQKLEEELIKYMYANNREKFSFPFSISRIFYEENKDALVGLNENSKITVRYNGSDAELFVSSFSYKMSSSEALPEISVSSNNEIGISSNSIRTAINDISGSLASAEVEINKVRQNTRPAISKLEDDTASGVVTFQKRQIFEKGLDSYEEINVGKNTRDGLSDGSGTLISDERIQTDNLEVRGSLKVLDLVASQIHSLDGYYYFSDTMQIKRVELTSVTAGSSVVEKTARIYFEKQYANDFLKFYVQDILLSTSINVDGSDASTDVKLDENTGNAYRDIALQSWMEVLATSASIGDDIWCDVRIIGDGALPREGSYVARRGNYNNESGRTSSWCISVEEGRIVYYINQTSKEIKDYNYGLVVGRLPDIAPVRNVGAVNEVGVYAKYLLAQHLITVQWAGDVQYVTVDKGDWNEDAAKAKEYFIKEETDKQSVTTITRTKVNHNQCVWICKANDDGLDYTIQEPKVLSESESKWALLSGGDAVTSEEVFYTTTDTNDNPIDGYESGGLSIGSDEVAWFADQSDCEYNALFPYMWKKTIKKTYANPDGEVKVELIGVYGQTGLNAHIEVDGGNNILVPCDSDGVVKEDFEAKRKVGFFLDDRELEIASYKHINVEDKHDFQIAYHKGTFKFSVPKGTKVTNGQKLTYRLVAIDNLSDKELEYTRTIDFLFVHNLSEKAITVQTTPLTAYIPVSNGLIAKSGSQEITVSVIKGETLMDGIDYYIHSDNVSYYGNATDYIDTSVFGNVLTMQYTEGVALSESDYATIEIELNNGLRSVVTVLQNISGRDAIGEDSYVATVTPQNIALPVSYDSFNIAWDYTFTLTAEMYKGNNPTPLKGTSVSVTLKPNYIKKINCEGNQIFVDFEFGVEFPRQPICIGANVKNGEISRKVEFTVTPIEGGKSGEDAYFASLTPQTLIVPVTNGDRKILGSPTFYLTAEMYKGSNEGALEGTTVSASSSHEAIASIDCNGNEIKVIMESGEQLSEPIAVEAAIKNGHVTQKLSFTLTPIEQGHKGDKGDKGDSGYAGPVQRVFSDKIVEGQEYRNDSDKEKAIGDRYQDMLTVYCPKMESGYLAFVCIETFTYHGKTIDLSGLQDAASIKNAMTDVGVAKYFQEVAVNASSAFFTQMFARNANIRMLSGATITMLNDNQVVAGMSNAKTENGQLGYHFWSGGETGKKAKFSVDEHGKLIAQDADIKGVVQVNALYYDTIYTTPETYHKLDPTKDSSTIVRGSGTFVLPNFRNFQGISYKFIQPIKSALFAMYIQDENLGTFYDADEGVKTEPFIFLKQGVIELIAISDGWCVIRYGTASIDYSNTLPE